MSDLKEVEPTTANLLCAAGGALLLVQLVEQLIKFGLRYVIPPSPGTTSVEWEKQSDADRTKTLGQLFKRVRARISVAPTLERDVHEFLNRRNEFVHHFVEAPGVSIHSPEGREVGMDMVHSLVRSAMRVYTTFAALLRSWMLAQGLEDFFSEVKAVQSLAEEEWKALAELFGPLSPRPS